MTSRTALLTVPITACLVGGLPASRAQAGPNSLGPLKLLDVKTDHQGLAEEGQVHAATVADGGKRLATNNWTYLIEKDGEGRLAYKGKDGGRF